MRDKIENVQVKVTETIAPVTGFGRNMVFMGLGTVGVMTDGVKTVAVKSGDVTHKLVERGEEVAETTREFMGGFVEEPQTKATNAFDRVNEQVLIRFNLPTTEDFDTLTRKVNAIDRKLTKALKEANKKVRPAAKKKSTTAAKKVPNGAVAVAE